MADTARIRVVMFALLVCGGIAFAAWWGTHRGATSAAISVIGENTSTMEAIKQRKGPFEQRSGTVVNCRMDTFEVLQEKANQDLSTGTGLYDIILNYNFSLAPYVRNNWVLPICLLYTSPSPRD